MRCAPLSLLLSFAVLASTTLAAPAQLKPASDKTSPASGKTSPDAPPLHTTSLPVTKVSLYKNGVGFFEHSGRVSGDANVTIDFTSAQLNDVLQSLTAIDLNGGRISGAGYNSTTPLDQQLKNLPIALGADPTAADFYAAIRGTRVEVHSGAASITGRLLSIESRSTPTDSDKSPATERQFLTVISDTGEARTLELTPATSVRLLDTALHTDVNRYLQLLDSTRSQGLRHLTLADLGSAPNRELHVSYISEVPVWKSTYRILYTGTNKTATLQGWSVVDNTTGTDWLNVHLSLIAGSPQSFIQPLSQPIYSRRPEIPIATEAQLTPQTFDSSIDGLSDSKSITQMSYARAGLALAPPAPPPSAAHMSAKGMASGVAGGMGIGPASTYQSSAAESISVATTTAAFDDFFAYNLTDPVTIRKNESALVPILQTKIDADPVTIVSYTTPWSTSQPLRALWITNTSGLTLDRGSFSLIDDGNFAGEGLLDPVHPGEKRLLSYAADQAIHVTTKDHSTQHLSTITASKGVVTVTRTQVESVDYLIHNSAPEARTVLLEYPVTNPMTLDPSTPKPDETTASVYRFRVSVAPGQTTTFPIAAHGPVVSSWQLTHTDDSQFNFMLNNADHNPTLVAAIQPILDARRHVAEAQSAVDKVNESLKALRSDEDRQRSNITALASADKPSRDRFVHDLNTTEDKITAAQSDLTTRTAALDAAKADLSYRIDNFSLETIHNNPN